MRPLPVIAFNSAMRILPFLFWCATVVLMALIYAIPVNGDTLIDSDALILIVPACIVLAIKIVRTGFLSFKELLREMLLIFSMVSRRNHAPSHD